MYKNKKYLFFYFSILLFITSYSHAFASANISSFLLNGTEGNITFNPNSDETVSIEVKSSIPVKFTRLYICSVAQTCNGTSGNYTRYFTQSNISDTISKVWNGKKSGDTEIVPDGEYKVMVSMTEGTSDPVLEFGKYSIFVNSSDVSTTTTSTTTSTTSESHTSSSSTSNISYIAKTVYISAHSNPEGLSDYTENVLNTSAGRPRMALIGSTLVFNAKYSINSKVQCNPYFRWVFGDGFDGIGKDISHIYKHEGEYNVVLNMTCGEYSSVSRTSVKVLKPDISLSVLQNGDVEVVNNLNTEINIGNWKIKGTNRDFVFPNDTIISANSKITLLSEDLGELGEGQRLFITNQIDREVAFYVKEARHIIMIESVKADPEISVDKAELLLLEYKKSAAYKNKINQELLKNFENKEDSATNKIDNTATVLDAIDKPQKRNFWSKVISVPINSIKNLISKFYDF